MEQKQGKWLSRKNIAVKEENLDKVDNLRWRYECSECGLMVQSKSDECPKCHAQMLEN